MTTCNPAGPSFVTEPYGSGMRENPQAVADVKAYRKNETSALAEGKTQASGLEGKLAPSMHETDFQFVTILRISRSTAEFRH